MNPQNSQLPPQQRRKQFLYGLGNVMLQRGVPLPPQLTGIPYPPTYDPSASPWRTLDISNTDVGVVRLAGKEVDLYKLWALVQQAGGSAKVRFSYIPSRTLADALVAQPTKYVGPAYAAPRPA